MNHTVQLVIATAIVSLLTGYIAGKISVVSQSVEAVAADQHSDDESEGEELEDASMSKQSSVSADNALEMFASEEHKLVLVVRTDLRMTKGKMAAQAGHATLACYKIASRSAPLTVRRWERSGQAKIALKGDSEEQLEILQATAISLGLTACIIEDAGRTQIAAGSSTVLGIGPGPKSLVNQVTGSLSLL